MLRIVSCVLALVAPTISLSDEESPARVSDIKALMRSLLQASTDEIYLVNTVQPSCYAVSSALGRQGTVHFRIDDIQTGSDYVYGRATVDLSESGELHSSGTFLYTPLLRFNYVTEKRAEFLLNQCRVRSDPIQLKINNVLRDGVSVVAWSASVASGYCLKPWLAEGCILGCKESVASGKSAFLFTSDRTRAENALREVGSSVRCPY